MIEVKVRTPKRLKGQYNFTSFEDLVRWININFRRPKGLAAEILISVAEQGSYIASTGRYSLECSYDKPIHYKAKELAREVGFLKSRGLGGDGGFNLEKVYEYIKLLNEAKPLIF